MRKKIIYSCLFLFLPSLLFAQSKVGTAGMQFLKIGSSARAVGMGEAFVAVANDGASLFYNPAGAAWLDKPAILFSYTVLPAGIKHNFLSLIYPRGGGVWGLSSVALTTDDMERMVPYAPDDHWDGTYFSCSDYSLALSHSRKLTDRFSTGVTIKYIRERLENEKVSGVGFDIGTFYDTEFKTIKMGMCLSNFGPDLKYFTETFPLPMNFKVGFSITPMNSQKHHLVVDLEGQHPNDNEERAIIGAEYTFNKLLSLRIGYKINYNTERYSIGTGLNLPLGGRQLRFNYAYTDWHYLTRMQRFSLEFVF